MNAWFRRRPVEPAVEPAKSEAYDEGRAAERARRGSDAPSPGEERARLNEAYDRGRRDARARRRGSPLIAFVVLVLVVIGAGLVYLAVRNGSFTNGGAVVDQNIQTAKAPIQHAADTAGNVLENAGANIKQHAGSSQP
jgi:hypothetical protein